MSETVVRLPDTDPGNFPEGFDQQIMSYWRVSTTWMMNFPGFVWGNLAKHEVEEHDDGTITVYPSILVTVGDLHHRHGFLKRGVWEPCGDDLSGTNDGG